ncbi:MAG: flavin reductase [Myxococcales bacterium]|nr:MAG: flavin reductase [Myxococcales bacterium]
MRSDEFREALARWASGVTVVATEHEGQRHGLTASAFTSVSLSPALILVCVDRRTDSSEALQRAAGFGVSVLAASQESEALQMARPGPTKFDGLPFVRGPVTGQPLLAGALAHLECRTYRIDDGGDHLIVLGEVLAVTTGESSALVYYRRGFHPVG